MLAIGAAGRAHSVRRSARKTSFESVVCDWDWSIWKAETAGGDKHAQARSASTARLAWARGAMRRSVSVRRLDREEREKNLRLSQVLRLGLRSAHGESSALRTTKTGPEARKV